MEATQNGMNGAHAPKPVEGVSNSAAEHVQTQYHPNMVKTVMIWGLLRIHAHATLNLVEVTWKELFLSLLINNS